MSHSSDLPTRIVEALFDQATLDGGLLKDKAIARVREVVAGYEMRSQASIVRAETRKVMLWSGKIVDVARSTTTPNDWADKL